MTSAYTPRPGTKTAEAYGLLLDGPQSAAYIASAIGIAPNNVMNVLNSAIDHGQIIKLRDETNLLHYALAGMPVDERFSAFGGGNGESSNTRGKPLTDAPLVRKVSNPKPPVLTAFDAADPFGLLARQQAQEKSNASQPAIIPASKTVETLPLPKSETTPTAFSAAIFSTGEMLIRFDGQTVNLSPDHALQLRKFINRFQEQA